MMKSILSLLFTIFSLSLFSAPGDTTHVIVHDKTLMGGYGAYSNWAVFPTAGKQYRKVTMIYKLQCPSSGCTDYDYTQKIFVSRQGGVQADTPRVEITRLINAFGRDISKTGPGLTYRSDVTDYISLLKDSVEITCNFEGYPANGEGWLLTLDFEFIEGIPPREAYKVQNMWNGYFAYGSLENGVDIIEKNLTEKQVTIDSNAAGTLLRIVPTGHGFGGAQNCAEFCRKKYYLKLDGTTIATQDIWREDCGENPVYPGFGAQANGTWPYDRANWCPGALVLRYDHDLSSVVNPKENHSLNIDMQTGIGGGAGYHFECQLIDYKPIAHATDVTLEEITSPSMAQDYNRLNPVCGDVKVIIRNTGSNDLTSVDINFGTKSGTPTIYKWTGLLKFMESQEVSIGQVNWAEYIVDSVLVVSVSNPNGVADEYADNNSLSSSYQLPPVFPNEFVILLTTNTRGFENEYAIYDINGEEVFSYTGFANTSDYEDTMRLADGCYTFRFNDSGEDGLSFFANSAGAGSLRFKTTNPSKNLKTFTSNFGSFIQQSFIVKGGLFSYAPGIANSIFDFNAYPNPANSTLYIDINNPQLKAMELTLTSILGKDVLVKKTLLASDVRTRLDLSEFAAGVYLVSLQAEGQVIRKKVVLMK